jgi:hypothetical protein
MSDRHLRLRSLFLSHGNIEIIVLSKTEREKTILTILIIACMSLYAERNNVQSGPHKRFLFLKIIGMICLYAIS